MPDQDTINKIRTEHPHLDLAAEHQDFIDYWLAAPGAKGVKQDWTATWRRWMRKNGKDKSAPQYRNQDQIMAANAQAARDRDQARADGSLRSFLAIEEGGAA